MPKFDPTADQLEEGLKDVESLFDEVDAADSDDEFEPLPSEVGAVKYMVMRTDGTLVDVADTKPQEASFDAEALGEEMAGFFDTLDGDDESVAQERHSVPIVQLRVDGVCELHTDVFAQILEHRIADKKSSLEAWVEMEDLLKAVQVLKTECEVGLEVYAVEGSALRGIYPAEGRSIADGSPLVSVRSQKGATGKFLTEGAKYRLKDAAMLPPDVLGKFYLSQKNTITAHPEPSVAAIAIDDMWATLLEGLFKNSIVAGRLSGKKIIGIGLHGDVAMVFNDLNPKSTICDREALKQLFPVLASAGSVQQA